MLGSLYRDSVKLYHSSHIMMTKAEVLSQSLEECVLRSVECPFTAAKYLSGLCATEKVKVCKDRSRLHALCGKPSNWMKRREVQLFVEFVRENRSPTGRKPDRNNRTHGAEYYCDSKWTSLRCRDDDGRNQKRPSKKVFGEAFILVLKRNSEKTVASVTPER